MKTIMLIRHTLFKRLIPVVLLSGLLSTSHAVNGQNSTKANDSGPRRVIIVLDASGSMWGRVQGRTKIEVAREVTRDFIKALPEDVELGLVAYGHRHKGDCKDIELLIPAGKVDRDLFIKKVDSLQPKGMTPLTDAVEFAAEALRFTEQKASVILVTDGEETCHRDPCAAAEKLEALGVDFTAHVIAFDLNDKAARSVECLATKTGGQFLKADDAATLADALSLALEAAVTPMVEEELGEAKITVPAEAMIGSEFEVKWEGPNNKGDYITIVPAGTDDGQHKNYTYTLQGSPLKLTALMQTGAAEVRYMTGRSGKVLGRAPITITEAKVTLKAADKAVAGAPVSVEWAGPNNKGDYITIVPKNAEDGKYLRYRYTVDGTPAKVEAPLEEGASEIRYMSGQGDKVLARREIQISKAEISLNAVDKVIAGSTVSVEWTGPNNKGDYVTIVPKETPDGHYKEYSYTERGNPLKIEAPLDAGTAEIRYMTEPGNKVLARREITVEAPVITLKAPDEAPAGSEVSVEWTGPNNKGDYVTIVTKDRRDGEYADYRYTKGGPTLKIKVPAKEGEAEIRYQTEPGNHVLSRRVIKITPATK